MGQGARPCPIARLLSRSVTGNDGDAILDLEVWTNSCRLGADDAERGLVCLLRRDLAGDFDRRRRVLPQRRASRRDDRRAEEQLLTHERVRDLRLKLDRLRLSSAPEIIELDTDANDDQRSNDDHDDRNGATSTTRAGRSAG